MNFMTTKRKVMVVTLLNLLRLRLLLKFQVILHILQKKSTAQNSSNSPLLKLDVKFELPMYNGELDAEKLDNWLK